MRRLRQDRHDRRHAASPGYTLVELLVVLALFGILLSIATLSAAPDPGAKLKRDAERLQTLFGLAAEEAQLRSRPIAWRADDKGYVFFLLEPTGWKRLDQDDAFKPRDWEAGTLKLDLRVEQRARNGLDPGWQTALEFPRDGIQPAFHLLLQADGVTTRWQVAGDGAGAYRSDAQP